MPIIANDPFKWRHFPGEVILLSVRWYLGYPSAYQHVAELLTERGVAVHATRIWRWVQTTDETYIKVKGEDKYLYRAVDSSGQTIDFLLTAKRDAAAAKRFFRKALSSPGNPVPRVINVDKYPAFPLAVEGLKAEGTLPRRIRLRQCKYLNNIGGTAPSNREKEDVAGEAIWFASHGLAQGIEAVNMIRKGRARWVAKDDYIQQSSYS